MPMPPPAPPLFSITTGWPRSRDMASATGRPTMSASPPGGNGTTMVTGLEGKGAWARARPAVAARTTARAARRSMGKSPCSALACYFAPQPIQRVFPMKIAAYLDRGQPRVGIVSSDLQSVLPVDLPPEAASRGALPLVELLASGAKLPATG